MHIRCKKLKEEGKYLKETRGETLEKITQLRDQLCEMKRELEGKESRLHDLQEREKELKLEIIKVKEDRQMRIFKAGEIQVREEKMKLRAARN